MSRGLAGVVAPALVVLLLATGCQGDGEAEPPPSSTPSPTEVTGIDEPSPPGPAERLGLATGWGPTQEQLDRAARLTDGLSLPELAGQVIVADYRGTTAPVDLVRRLHLGGVIAFSANVVSAEQMRRVGRRLRTQVDRPWPLIVAVDQEGGLVERVRTGVARFPTFMSAGAAHDADLTRRSYAAQAGELRRTGFDLDFAPVADVTSGPGDPTIGSRSAGSDPEAVAEQVVAASQGYLEVGVVPVLKHFPGHGSVPADSHRTLPVQTRTMRQLRAIDLVPFAAGVEAGVPAVMVGHLDVRAVDPRVPSSLSREVVTRLLRDDLGFQGVAVTDSLQMAGVRAGRTSARLAVQALRAGNDVLLMPPDPAAARAGIVAAVREGRLARARLRQAAARTIALMLYQRSLAADAASPGQAAARRASRALSAAAVTVVAGPCQGRLVGEAVSPSGSAAAVAGFAAAARAAGLGVLLRRPPPPRLVTPRREPERQRGERRRDFRERHRAWRRAERRRQSRLASWMAVEDARLSAGTSVAFSGYGGGPVSARIAVATDTPYVLGRSSAAIKVATYGDTPGAMSVLVDVLLGATPAPGRLPVPVRGVSRQGC